MGFEYHARPAAPRRLFASAILGIVALALSASVGAATPVLKTLWSFCSDAHQCKSGAIPYGMPVQDGAGNFYGTTYAGGKFNAGVIYKLAPDGTYEALHEFCPRCGDGVQPETNLIIDANGALYGTTQFGGGADGNAGGTVFKLTQVTHKSWKFTVLYTFCLQSGCVDGQNPVEALTYQGAQSGVPYDGKSPLFGANTTGGLNGDGNVFELKPVKKHWTETTLYNFCSQPNCTDGSQPLPRAGLLIDASGNLYGPTQAGGDADFGVVFELSPSGGSYTEQVLHSFCGQTDCADGGGPSSVVMDGQGSLYGSTLVGGPANAGLVFSLQFNGTRWRETVLYNFCPDMTDCADGRWPLNVTLAPNGDLVGTTQAGGAHYSKGVVFQLHGATQSVLYSFCAKSGCLDGELPLSGVIMGASGDLYGTTTGGGYGKKYQAGTLYELTP